MYFKRNLSILLGPVFAFLFGTVAWAGSWQEKHNGQMDYSLYVPDSALTSTGVQSSLMISLHGCSQRSSALEEAGNWEQTSETNQMIVALPQVPNGGVILGCWDYYGTDHNETSRNDKDIISLIQNLLKNKKLNIDPKKIYLSGISSGGAQALLVACLRPDLVAGVGLSSTPGLGTSIGDFISPTETAEETKDLCLKLAKHRTAYFDTQTAVIITSDYDYVVNPAHSELNRDMLKILYDVKSTQTIDPKTLPGTQTNGEALVFLNSNSQSKLSYLVNDGLGHNWPGGQGGGTFAPYVSTESINFPAYLANFFKLNQYR